MTTWHKLFCEEFLCFSAMPCHHMPLFVHFWEYDDGSPQALRQGRAKTPQLPEKQTTCGIHTIQHFPSLFEASCIDCCSRSTYFHRFRMLLQQHPATGHPNQSFMHQRAFLSAAFRRLSRCVCSLLTIVARADGCQACFPKGLLSVVQGSWFIAVV